MDTLGTRIKEARTGAGLKKIDLARACGLSSAAITKWEADRVDDLRIANLFALEDLTGYRARWIGLGQLPKKVEEQSLTQEEWRVILARRAEIAAAIAYQKQREAPTKERPRKSERV